MSEFVCNGPVSRPIKAVGIKPDVDFGGLMWSHQHGLVFDPQEDFMPIKLPPPRG